MTRTGPSPRARVISALASTKGLPCGGMVRLDRRAARRCQPRRSRRRSSSSRVRAEVPPLRQRRSLQHRAHKGVCVQGPCAQCRNDRTCGAGKVCRGGRLQAARGYCDKNTPARAVLRRRQPLPDPPKAPASSSSATTTSPARERLALRERPLRDAAAGRARLHRLRPPPLRLRVARPVGTERATCSSASPSASPTAA